MTDAEIEQFAAAVVSKARRAMRRPEADGSG